MICSYLNGGDGEPCKYLRRVRAFYFLPTHTLMEKDHLAFKLAIFYFSAMEMHQDVRKRIVHTPYRGKISSFSAASHFLLIISLFFEKACDWKGLENSIKVTNYKFMN